MVLNRAQRDDEAVGDVSVGQAERGEGGDLPLAGGQLTAAGRARELRCEALALVAELPGKRLRSGRTASVAGGKEQSACVGGGLHGEAGTAQLGEAVGDAVDS